MSTLTIRNIDTEFKNKLRTAGLWKKRCAPSCAACCHSPRRPPVWAAVLTPGFWRCGFRSLAVIVLDSNVVSELMRSVPDPAVLAKNIAGRVLARR